MRDFTGLSPQMVPSDPEDLGRYLPTLRRDMDHINWFLRDASFGFGRIQNGQIPDGSGRSLSEVIDLSDYLYLPGRFGGQEVQGLQNDLSPIVTLHASDVGTTLMRWEQGSNPAMDLVAVANGAATDYQFISTGSGAGLQIQMNVSGSGIRITNQAALSSLVRGFIEAGPTSENMALSGFNGATGTSLHSLFTYAHFNTWTGTALSNTGRVGINTDPYEYRSSAAASQPDSLIVARRTGATTAVPTFIIEGASSTDEALSIRNVSIGTAPTRTISGTIRAGIRMNGDFELGESGSSGVQGLLNGGLANEYIQLTEESNNAVALSMGRVAAWSDSLAISSSNYMLLGNTLVGHRSIFLATRNGAGATFDIFTRFGISSAYTLLSNGQAGGAQFPAPEATPTVLRLYNAATGGADASIVLKVESARAGQSAALQAWLTSAGTAASIDSTGKVIATTGWRNPHNSEWPATSLTTLTSSPTAYNIGNGTFLRQDATGTRTIQGIAGGTDGRFLLWRVTGSTAYTFGHERAGASAANRIHSTSGIDVEAHLDQTYLIYYDPTTARWILQKWAEPGADEVIFGAWNWQNTLTIQGDSGGALSLVDQSGSTLPKIAFTDASSNILNLSSPTGSGITAGRTLYLPDASDTLVGKATTDNFTNKTLDTSGCRIECSTQTTGVYHYDTTDDTKRFRWVLSGQVTGADSAITVTGTRSNLYSLDSDFDCRFVTSGDNDVAAAGGGTAGELGKHDSTGNTATIAATTLGNTLPAGMYRLTWYAKVTTAGQVTDTLTVACAWNDGSAQTATLNAEDETTLLSALGMSTLNRAYSGTKTMYAAAGTNISFTATLVNTAGAPDPVYTFRARLEAL